MPDNQPPVVGSGETRPNLLISQGHGLLHNLSRVGDAELSQLLVPSSLRSPGYTSLFLASRQRKLSLAQKFGKVPSLVATSHNLQGDPPRLGDCLHCASSSRLLLPVHATTKCLAISRHGPPLFWWPPDSSSRQGCPYIFG